MGEWKAAQQRPEQLPCWPYNAIELKGRGCQALGNGPRLNELLGNEQESKT